MNTHPDTFLSMAPGISESILHSLQDRICLIDPGGVIRFVNKEWIRFAVNGGGALPDTGLGMNYLDFCKAEPELYEGLQAVLEGRKDEFTFEYPGQPLSGNSWFLMQATPLYSKGVIEGLVIRHADITKQKQLELQLQHYAEKDSLTSLYNRRFFEKKLAKEKSRAFAAGRPVALLYIDIDNFKHINDVHGHAAGDRVLKKLAGQITAALPPSGTAARIGGDEFAVILPDAGRAALEHTADQLLQLIQQQQDSPLHVTISMGGKSFRNGSSPASMTEWVDKALYEAKNEGKNKAVILP